MNWPKQVPFFTTDNVHNIDGEYTIIEKGVTKRCSMGWLKHLFLDFNEFGPLDMSKLREADIILRKIGKISRYDSIEEWNDQQTRKNIADVLNKTMEELGYHIDQE